MKDLSSGPVGSTIWEVFPGLQRDGTEIFTHQELLNGLAKGHQILTWHVLHRNHYQVTSRDVTTEVKIWLWGLGPQVLRPAKYVSMAFNDSKQNTKSSDTAWLEQLFKRLGNSTWLQPKLVGGWTNPFEKNRMKLDHLPKSIELWNSKKIRLSRFTTPSFFGSQKKLRKMLRKMHLSQLFIAGWQWLWCFRSWRWRVLDWTKTPVDPAELGSLPRIIPGPCTGYVVNGSPPSFF